ncbi:MAG: hypothetical protein EZS28_012326 [Streblomastix strix]|uniref:SPRY domain-containing protein n=1 Tax=Streblomastix strix TaxID=222440 RepID=A0A5J4WB48_9EUKA|nr:MAG: hypothetical protein EZS28_012326 [Streblomastix strix]
MLGLGEYILLEIISEMIFPQDVQQFLVFKQYLHSLQRKHGMGIADASCSFAVGKGPSEDGNKKKTVRYFWDGELDHITNITHGSGSYEDGQRISAIVDMTSNPRKVVFYVDDIEQPNYVIKIPSEIRFWACTYGISSSFKVTKFQRLIQFTSQRDAGSKALKWGKSWE